MMTSQKTPLDLLPPVISECAVWTGKTGVCVSDDAVRVIARAFNINDSLEPEEIIEKAKNKTGCPDQRCLITQVGSAVNVPRELGTLKQSGPTDDTLLSNVNIDSVLQSWTQKYRDFFPYNFNMADYKSYCFRNGKVINEPDTLATVSLNQLYPRFKRAACVINSDKYHGPGKHWMALFIDLTTEPKTIEFFNSSGNSPQVAWVDWMVKIKDQAEAINMECELVKVSSIRHQDSRTECGVYSLFYIWCRLNNVPYSYFLENKLNDEHCFHFRQHLFASDLNTTKKGTTISGTRQWNWEEYQREHNLKWESTN